jgi:hypothetical protein
VEYKFHADKELLLCLTSPEFGGSQGLNELFFERILNVSEECL